MKQNTEFLHHAARHNRQKLVYHTSDEESSIPIPIMNLYMHASYMHPHHTAYTPSTLSVHYTLLASPIDGVVKLVHNAGQWVSSLASSNPPDESFSR